MADPANYYRIKVTDADGASAFLPMADTTRTFLLDQGIGVVIDRDYKDATGTTLSLHAMSGYGWSQEFTINQTLTLTALTIEKGLTVVRNTAAAGTPCTVRGAILDTAGRVLASGYAALPGGWDVANGKRFVFSVSARLDPGTYWLAWDCFEDGPAYDATSNTDPVRLGWYESSGGSTARTNALSFTGRVRNVYHVDAQPTPAQLATVTWEKVFAKTQTYPPGTGYAESGIYTRPGSWNVLGSPSGLALLGGDLTFDVDAVGTPPAGAAGSDLSLNALLTTE